MEMDNKNMLLAIVLSMVIMGGWIFYQQYVQGPRRAQLAEQQRQAEQAQQTAPTAQTGAAPAGAPASSAGSTEEPSKPRAEVIAASHRVPLRSPSLIGTINLDNGRIDDVVLRDYREHVDPNSPLVTLLSPSGSPNPYFAEFGWFGKQGTFGAGGTNWQAQGTTLAPGTPLVLNAQTDQGLSLTRTYTLDDKYMFTVTDRLVNNSNAPVTLTPFARLTRINTPQTMHFRVLHEGPIGILDGTLHELSYSGLKDDYKADTNQIHPTKFATTGGWLGITDKYWLAALVPDQTEPVNVRFFYDRSSHGGDLYQADVADQTAQIVQPGGSIEAKSRFFAGAKVFSTLVDYRDNHNVPRFERAIDFGWFFFITKPLLQVLIFLANHLAGLGVSAHFGIAILIVTVILKLCFFPLANKSYRSMSKMKALQPKMTELREKFSDDKQKLQQELMGLYKREKVNPVSGCLPIALQIPVFFALYKVLFVSIEMRQQPFYGWISDLSVRDPTNIFNLFGLVSWDLPPFLTVPSIFAIGAWPLLMGASMFLQQRLNPTPADPIQARLFMAMPLIFMFFLARMPVGLVIYWTWNNLLSIAQQYVIMRRMGVAIGGGKLGGAKTT